MDGTLQVFTFAEGNMHSNLLIMYMFCHLYDLVVSAS
jgi:hypothetical protein